MRNIAFEDVTLPYERPPTETDSEKSEADFAELPGTAKKKTPHPSTSKAAKRKESEDESEDSEKVQVTL